MVKWPRKKQVSSVHLGQRSEASDRTGGACPQKGGYHLPPRPHRQRGFNGDVVHAHRVRPCVVGNTLLSLTSSFRYEGRSWSQVGCGSAAPQVPLMDKRVFYFWSSLPRARATNSLHSPVSEMPRNFGQARCLLLSSSPDRSLGRSRLSRLCSII